MFFKQISPTLALRELQEEDAPVYFALVERNRAMLDEWEPGMAFTSEEGVRAFLGHEKLDFRRLPMNVGIFEQGELVGMVQLSSGNQRAEGTIGYWLSADYHGRGLVTESVRALVEEAFEEMGFERVVIDCSERNVRSRRVPERLGFILERVVPPEQLRRGPDGPAQLFFAMPRGLWRGEVEPPDALSSRPSGSS